jgi:2-polyprenyl-3-methyl-5-hydroxy-6-metoxy-1,4-benzoquinol methylase
MKKTSQATLESASQNYYFSAQQTGIDNRFRERMIRRCLKHLEGPEVLELGFMDGQWTDHFLAKGCNVTVVEGATKMVEYARQKYAQDKRVKVIHSLFEDLEPTQKFNTILMGGMLKHLPEPEQLLRRSLDWLQPKGILIATTPNPRSLHRRIGTYMGILPTPDALTAADIAVANLRHYDRYSFAELLRTGGYKIRELKTAMLKLASGEKIEGLDDNLLDALDAIADEIPDYGWYIYAICERP